ncbi:type 1 fimbrial protein [Enterobacteriaceae bacterium YMB-R22]|uniref:fimbrial protein n=1 Tax=Tenebrionicola larvae TaxID=2815733 RepID=UPI0020134ED3|nr:fimbrial protein [Tenebrionicola larvae]MBV4413719.1 type 1 fimbrial protein [Tenebrionicola larvae]
MKLNKIMLTGSLILGMSAFAHATTDQGSGTVTFTGSIIDAPCSINPDSTEQQVKLGKISSVALQNSGKSTPKNFEIHLENCSLSTQKTVTTTFTGPAGANGLLGITGSAKGASIALLDASNNPIELGKPTTPQALQVNENTLLFSAYLQGDGSTGNGEDGPTPVEIVPGSFESIANFILTYQ